MEKVFCRKCGYRIWRSCDEGAMVDTYFQDVHMRCEMALANRGVIPEGKQEYVYPWRERADEQTVTKTEIA